MAANKTLANMLGYESPDELVANVTDIGAQLFVDPGERAEAVSVAAETKQYLGKEIAYAGPMERRSGCRNTAGS